MMKKAGFIAVILLSLFSCKNAAAPKEGEMLADSVSVSYGSVSDNRGVPYKTVTIGSQEWMAENMWAIVFNNGDKIPQAQTEEAWKKAAENQQPAWCYFEYDGRVWPEYGVLYNWYAVTDPRGIAPEGWQVPSVGDWKSLQKTLVTGVIPGAGDKKNADRIIGQNTGMQGLDLDQYLSREEVDSLAWEIKLATTAGMQLKSTDSWSFSGVATNGDNRSGFGGMGYGYRYSYHFMFPGEETGWWTTTGRKPVKDPEPSHREEFDLPVDTAFAESASFASLSYDHMFFPDQWSFKENGYYVRCVRKR